jgi:hypothetical protein
MCPMTRSPMLQPLLSPFRRSQQKTLALVIAAIAAVAHATFWALVAHLAVQVAREGEDEKTAPTETVSCILTAGREGTLRRHNGNPAGEHRWSVDHKPPGRREHAGL